MASKVERVLGKLKKNYHSENRFLFIVLYAKKSSKTVTKLQNELNEKVRKDPSLANVRIITLEEYLQFLNVGEKHIKLFEDINDLVIRASSHGSGAFDKLENLMRKYQSALLTHTRLDFFYRYLGWAKKI
jgi:protoheme ferro-lyase